VQPSPASGRLVQAAARAVDDDDDGGRSRSSLRLDRGAMPLGAGDGNVAARLSFAHVRTPAPSGGATGSVTKPSVRTPASASADGDGKASDGEGEGEE